MDLISVSESNSTTTLRFEQPERRNALSVVMLEALIDGLDRIARDDRGSILRLEGAGSAFCAGIDLDAGRENPDVLQRLLELLSKSMQLIRAMPRVVIAQVQGAAIAGGCALLSACDFTCGEPGTKVGYPVTRVGLSAAVSVPTLTGSIDSSSIRSLLLEGSVIDAFDARRIGILTHLADSVDALPRMVDDLCGRLSRNEPTAMLRTKAWLNELDGTTEATFHESALVRSVASGRTDEAMAMLKQNWAGKEPKR
ncbi:MAG: enoyl-CoA hydratase/isomerase family protein [Planctomycetota bacterium]|nr:enoyl-CoA hydratase/isomerase family protein [Planctomycetota bacterium]